MVTQFCWMLYGARLRGRVPWGCAVTVTVTLGGSGFGLTLDKQWLMGVLWQSAGWYAPRGNPPPSFTVFPKASESLQDIRS